MMIFMSAPSGRFYSEYDRKYQARRDQVRKRVARNRNRRRWLREGKAKVGDRKDIHHKDGNTQNNSSGNLASMDQSKNRAKKKA